MAMNYVKYLTYLMVIAGLVFMVFNQLLIGIILIFSGVVIGSRTMKKTDGTRKQK